MRADMAKVIVERPRLGSRYKHEGKGYHRRRQRLAPEDQPRRERMKARSGGGKMLNEHLAPLRRFLESCVGEHWDDVFAEVCEHISRDSAVQDHVRDHVADFVATHVVLIDGVPCAADGRLYGRPLGHMFLRQRLYVCPRTGLLRRLELPSRKRPRPKPPRDPRPVRLDAGRQCRWVDGAWHLVTLAPLPLAPWHCPGYDVVLRRRVDELTPEQVMRAYGARVYAAAKRRLGKKEMRQLPIPIDQQR